MISLNICSIFLIETETDLYGKNRIRKPFEATIFAVFIDQLTYFILERATPSNHVCLDLKSQKLSKTIKLSGFEYIYFFLHRVKELRKVLKSMGEKVSHKQLKQMMKFADQNGDGLIDFEGLKLLHLYFHNNYYSSLSLIRINYLTPLEIELKRVYCILKFVWIVFLLGKFRRITAAINVHCLS